MDLETCKRKLIDELLAHEKDELKKSCAYQIDRIISKSRGFSVGTVRVWNGQKHRKVAPGKWVPVYNGDGRAASQSSAHVARQIEAAKDFKELGEIVSQNLRRFTVGGKLLPVARVVLDAAKKRQGELRGRELTGKQSFLSDEALRGRIDTGKQRIDEFFKESWDSKEYMDMGRDRLMDLWAVGEAKRLACIHPEAQGLKGKDKKAALEFNEKVEAALKKYAAKVFEEYKAKDSSKKDGGKVEPVSSPRNIKDDDFTNPHRSVSLVPMTNSFYKQTGVEMKPILIKKNIFEKNLKHHKDLSPADSRKILNAALYETTGFINDKPSSKPNYYMLVKLDNGKNALVCLDTDPNKKYHEIVGWRYAKDSSIEEIKKRAAKEGAQFLMTETAQGDSSRSAGLSDVLSNPASNILQSSPSVKRKLLDTFEWNGAGNGREESYSGDTEKFIRQQVKEAIEKKDVDALYYMLKSKDRYMNARFAVQYARDCFNEMEGENGISFPRAHWTSWKYEESDLKGALKKWADKKKAESKKTKKSCAERINELKKAVFAGMGETA